MARRPKAPPPPPAPGTVAITMRVRPETARQIAEIADLKMWRKRIVIEQAVDALHRTTKKR